MLISLSFCAKRLKVNHTARWVRHLNLGGKAYPLADFSRPAWQILLPFELYQFFKKAQISMYMKHLDFFKEGIRNIRTTGTITRSSRFLCREMIRPLNFEKAKIIVELGAGDGVITRQILSRMSKDAKLISFEVNEKFCEVLRNIKDPRLVVAEDSAENIMAHLKAHGFEQTDYIVSALPFLSLPKELGTSILQKSAHALRHGGIFTQMQYSLFLKHTYEAVFDRVTVRFVPLNVPPAFVFICEKALVEP